MIAIQWTGRLGRCFGTTYLAGTAVLGASQYSDGVLAVLFLQVVVLRLNATETKTIRYNTSGLWHHVRWLVVSNVTNAGVHLLHHDQAWHKNHESTVMRLQKFCDGSSIIFSSWQLQGTSLYVGQSSVSTGWHTPPILTNNVNKILWRWMQCVPPKPCYSAARPAVLNLGYVDRFQGVLQIGRGEKYNFIVTKL